MIGTDARTLTDTLLDELRSVPDGEKTSQCLQCGTCTASCPSSHMMEYSPRAVIAAVRAGMLDQVVDTKTVWMWRNALNFNGQRWQAVRRIA